MNRASFRAVVDASVAVKMFVPESLSVEAQEIFTRFATEENAELIVPDLFFIECANVFWKWVQRSKYSAKDAQEHLHDLSNLGLTVLSTQILANDALEIALDHKATAYDACYIVAATKLQVPLITADERLVKQVKKGKYDIRWLGELSREKD